MSTPGRQRGLLSLSINNAREYFRSYPAAGNERKSPTVVLCGLRWHLEAYRKMENGVPHVGAYVCCSNDGEDSWKCKATCIFRIVNTVADDVIRRKCEKLCNGNWGCDDLLPVEDLLKHANGYIKNNTVTIECNTTAFMSPLSEVAQRARGSKRRCTDVKLVVEGRAVYANKGVLAVSCDYFEALFYGDFDDRHKDEIALDDVKHKDLVAFLKVINPPCAPVY
ncbi:BTB/POZ domain-containing protein, partial [Aphelenchoides avenae]